ncbi:hypothetical protein [Phytohabitans kaempferiae]|uniref:Uncharacterized protein n=1 Tax=Phytohabitans kaempferiae TaxID=1620943 RepID=A0ABV6M9C4_9ACTN
MIRFAATRWRLPITMNPINWAYGTSLVPIPDTTSVLMSLPSGGRPRWCVVDLVTGQMTGGTGMPGHLRAAAFPTPGRGDDRPWVLGTHGLGRLELAPKSTITEVTRKGIGTYPSTLLPLGDGLLGIGHRHGRSLLLVSTSDGAPVIRLKVAGPDIAYPLSDQRIRILGPHHAQATDVDVTTVKVVARHQMPYGKHVHHANSAVTALLGERAGYENAGGVWHIVPRRVAVLDPQSLTTGREAPAPPDAVEVLGSDQDDRLVITNHHGLVLLDPATLAPAATYQLSRRIRGAALCPGRNLAALLGGDDQDDALHMVTW